MSPARPVHDLAAFAPVTPEPFEPKSFADAAEAIARIRELYQTSIAFLENRFVAVMKGEIPEQRYRAYYPEIVVEITTHTPADSRLSFGHFAQPGTYATTVTRPDLFGAYLKQQLDLIIRNHGVRIGVRQSSVPIPIHFAMDQSREADTPEPQLRAHLRDLFDTPNLADIDDKIVNADAGARDPRPLAPFTAQRVDYSLARLSHYTATLPEHFQNHILFTNYQFYMDEFVAFAKNAISDPARAITSWSSPAISFTTRAAATVRSRPRDRRKCPRTT